MRWVTWSVDYLESGEKPESSTPISHHVECSRLLESNKTELFTHGTGEHRISCCLGEDMRRWLFHGNRVTNGQPLGELKWPPSPADSFTLGLQSYLRQKV